MKTNLDISKHILIPLHTKLNEKEKEILLQKYNASTGNLPRISEKDKSIENLKVKEGDIIKITRKSQTAGTAYFYRVVVND
ncbi:DNA-directed RNA polymerase subunit H [Candidatus Woesearchaeota archaeon]|nr:DNA-directed RNA polymerase subunit H [Candidatus Woesearchaeota archaeon]